MTNIIILNDITTKIKGGNIGRLENVHNCNSCYRRYSQVIVN